MVLCFPSPRACSSALATSRVVVPVRHCRCRTGESWVRGWPEQVPATHTPSRTFCVHRCRHNVLAPQISSWPPAGTGRRIPPISCSTGTQAPFQGSCTVSRIRFIDRVYPAITQIDSLRPAVTIFLLLKFLFITRGGAIAPCMVYPW